MRDEKSRSVLQNHYEPGEYGAIDSTPGVLFRERWVQSLFQINGFKLNRELDTNLPGVEKFPEHGKSIINNDVVVMSNGPEMYLYESGAMPPAQLLSELRDVLHQEGATVTNLSSARTIIRAQGPQVRSFLKKGCPIDVDSLAENDVVSTLVGHFSVTIHSYDSGFDIYALQTFGLDFWLWCQHNAQEFGYGIEVAR